MSLLNVFNKSPKGDSYRIVNNPIKYVGYVLSEILKRGTTNNAASKTKSNPSSTVSSQDSGGVTPK